MESAPRGFLDLPVEFTGPDSLVRVLCVPYEATTTYGAGTCGGPAAIIQASAQVEYYDRELRCEAALRYGIQTLPPVDVAGLAPEDAIDRISSATLAAFDPERLLCVLGGEHGVSIGVSRGLRAAGCDYVVVQLDAHADLRDSYLGSSLSHACAARRIAETGVPIVQLGVRSLDLSEARYLESPACPVTCIEVEALRSETSWRDRVRKAIRNRDVYLTIDVDALDPSVVPSTGTPEPDGLTWNETLEIIRLVTGEARVIAFDCVELAPSPGLHHADFAVAKLVYKTMNLAMSSRGASKGVRA